MADYVSKYDGSEVEGILDEAIELPQATSEDEGKFLKINDQGELIWQYIPDWVFTEGESGQYLRMTGSTAHPGWDNADDPLPSRTLANDGDVLKYNGDGLEWSPLIDTSNASANEFLKYNGTGNLVWDKPVPDFDSSDLNKALMIIYDSGHPKLKWDNPNPIDTSDASDGEFLKYSSNTGIMWDTLIDTSNADDGKFLKYSSDNGIIWDNPLELNGGYSGGSFLSYNNDGPLWVTPAGSPSVGEVLTILSVSGSGNFDYEWSRILPIYDTSDPSDDAGKVLTVLDNGTLGWVLPNQ